MFKGKDNLSSNIRGKENLSRNICLPFLCFCTFGISGIYQPISTPGDLAFAKYSTHNGITVNQMNLWQL